MFIIMVLIKLSSLLSLSVTGIQQKTKRSTRLEPSKKSSYQRSKLIYDGAFMIRMLLNFFKNYFKTRGFLLIVFIY